MVKKLFNHKIGILLLIAVAFMLALATLHALAYAQGIGLYYAMQKGEADRAPYDRMVDICGMLTLLFVLACPFILLGYRKVESFFRLVATYFAFMPVLNMAVLALLFDGHKLLVVSHNMERNMSLWSSFPKEVVPVMFLLGGLYISKGLLLKKWHKVLLILAVFLAMAVLILPELSDVLLHLMSYLLVIVAFDWWEKVFAAKKEKYETVIMWLMFVVFFTRGCYRMLEILEAYPIIW